MVEPGDWLADSSLRQLALPEEGAIVLGIRREVGGYLGGPGPEAVVRPGDTVQVYGLASRLDQLKRRPGGPDGQASRTRSIAEHQDRQATEQARERRRLQGRSHQTSAAGRRDGKVRL